ncbi:MAG: hypothetical protein N2039_08795 [Gemmataceae bacterium]|nr:hypothetical protein [Gemmataceae bacterium]
MWDSTDAMIGWEKWVEPSAAPQTKAHVLSCESPQLVGSLPVDFVPIHVSLACVLVIALLVGWDTRRRGGAAWGSGRRI